MFAKIINYLQDFNMVKIESRPQYESDVCKENRCAREGTRGSNPLPSAKYTNFQKVCYIY